MFYGPFLLHFPLIAFVVMLLRSFLGLAIFSLVGAMTRGEGNKKESRKVTWNMMEMVELQTSHVLVSGSEQ
jgi:hypothetical protein